VQPEQDPDETKYPELHYVQTIAEEQLTQLAIEH